MFFLRILKAAFSFTLLFAASIPESTQYPEFCLMAATDEHFFRSFKRDRRYTPILEHVSQDLGLKYLKKIEQNYPYVWEHVEKCRENDRLGNPATYDYGPVYGSFSPTTLRYMKVAGELISLFGDLNHAKIVEIGGGYGGQCKILSELAAFQNYTLIDLPECVLLAQKYLHLLQVERTSYMSNQEVCNLVDSYDLVISNYAFSEVSRDEQIVYVEKILNKSRNGYLTCNFTSDLFNIDSLSLNELLSLLQKPHRRIDVHPESPNTRSDNVLILWHEDS